MSGQERVRAGVPSGGQFAEKSHGEPEVTLGTTSDDTESECVHCGAPVVDAGDGVTVHLDDDGEYDYEADGDHVAVPSLPTAIGYPEIGSPVRDVEDKPEVNSSGLASRMEDTVAMAADEAEYDSDDWSDPNSHRAYVNAIRGAKVWADGDHAVVAKVEGTHGYVAGDLLDRASQRFDCPDDTIIEEQDDGSHRISWGGPGHRSARPAPSDDGVGRTIYEQIGPIVAGNMDAKARNATLFDGGIRMAGCRMGARKRADVIVRLNGAGTYDVAVNKPRQPGGMYSENLHDIRDVDVSQLRGLMLDIGDGNKEKLAGWHQ